MVRGLGLILRKRWSFPVLVLSLLGILVQDVALFALSDGAALGGTAVYVLQGLVLVVGIALVILSRKASAQGWLS